MNSENKPKVFISYSWTVKDWTIQLATRLMNDGVEVKVDFWDLKEGQDKYKFMESMVADKTIDYVLILCDETYSKKADNRTGGVGDETIIISSELYGKSSQTKFIPLVLSKDEDDKAIVPIYVKSRIYFDFTNAEEYENEYEKLLRHIYNQPLIPKPKIGKKPEWLNECSINISSLSKTVSILKTSNNETRKNAVVQEFYQEFSTKVKEFVVDETKDLGQEIFDKINALKPLRDLYLDFLQEIVLTERNVDAFVCTFFEKVYNNLMLLPSNKRSWYPAICDHYKFLIWEMFVCTIAYLRYYEKYREIYLILTHTYYLQMQVSSNEDIKPTSILNFRCYSETIEHYGADKRLYSFAAEIAVNRIKEPLITKKTFAETDVFICQMSFALKINKNDFYWFPNAYVYLNGFENSWIRLSSKQYCEKILPLFNAKSIDELVHIIQENAVKQDYRYASSWNCVPRIPVKFGEYNIASLP